MRWPCAAAAAMYSRLPTAKPRGGVERGQEANHLEQPSSLSCKNSKGAPPPHRPWLSAQGSLAQRNRRRVSAEQRTGNAEVTINPALPQPY